MAIQNDFDTNAVLKQFKDDKEIPNWARNDVAWAVVNGIITGSDGKFLPKGTLNREQTVAIIHRAVNLVMNSVGTTTPDDAVNTAITELKAQMESMQDGMEESIDAIIAPIKEELTQVVSDITEKLNTFDTEKKNILEQIKTSNESVQTLKDELNQKIADMQADIKAIQGANVAVGDDELQNQFTDAITKLFLRLQGMSDTMNANANKVDEISTSYKEHVEMSNQTHEEINKKLEEFDDRFTPIEGEDPVEGGGTLPNETITKMQKEIDALKVSMEELKTDLSDSITTMTNENAATKKSVEAIKTSVTEMNTSITDKYTEVGELIKTINVSLATYMETTNKQITEMGTLIADMKKQIGDIATDIPEDEDDEVFFDLDEDPNKK